MFNVFKRKEIDSPIRDLDRIASRDVSFLLHGKRHVIKPMTALQFFDFSQALGEMQNLAKENAVSPSALIDAYFKLISVASKDIKKTDLEKCSVQQIGALVSLIIRTVMGEELSKDAIESDVGVKKKIMLASMQRP